ncbi:RNA polymerase II-associated protein 1 [Entomortierella parvispora]|uniref:RNA polymerase II-associated protein 1 n=1 Tax=Entomortierella parvispora TaxID=205924 RepID=A0A9P3H813_9FUNG|nr:RNA polymerase II-associated protein 1 [Entomortierella parvispora]
MDEDNNPMEEERRRVEHARVIRQRRQVPETEEDLLAMQEEFFKAQDRPAASVVRVQRLPPVVQSSPSTTQSKATTVQDDDDDDMPPPLEKDVVALDGDDLPVRPPTITPSGVLRGGSRFLQNRADKGPRTHFQTVGERFEINLDDDEGEPSSDRFEEEIPAETEEETMRRLASAGPSMGHILNEVLEKPVGEAIAPAGATTTLGSLEPTMRPSKTAAKGKSLFARRLAEAQGTATPKSSSNDDRPASSSYVKLTQGKDVVQNIDEPSSRPTSRPPRSGMNPQQSPNTALPPRPTSGLHSVLKKPDTPHSTLMEQIDDENRHKLANMSQQEIEEARAELMRNIDPELINKLMKRKTPQRRVSFSEGVHVEGKVVNMQEAKSHHEDSTFQSKRHEEEEGDHPLAMKKKYFQNVPAEPEKMEWMGIEGTNSGGKISVGKSVAPGVQPYTVSDADPPAAHYRFDFAGKIIQGEDTPVHLGLHHHGADPTKAGYTLSELLHLIRSTVPSQRIIPLNILAKILRNCRDAEFGAFTIRSGILRWLIDRLRAPVYLRAALDDKTDSGLVAAVNALHAWAMPPGDIARPEEIWELLDLLDRGYERINLGFKYQAITHFANMELKPDTLQASQEQGTEGEETIGAHAILAAKDPFDGLIAMSVLPRLRYILDVCQLPAHTNSQVLDILLSLVRTHAGAAKKVFECEGFIATLVRQFGTISWPSEKTDVELSCSVKAIAVLDTTIRSSKKHASAIIEEGHLEPLLRFLVLTPEPLVGNRQSFEVQTQVLKLFRSLSAYGLYCNVLADSMQSRLLQDAASTIVERSKENIDPVVKSFLSRKLTVFFQLATAWTHAAADAHRTVPEHSLCWAQATSFLDIALDGVAQWGSQSSSQDLDLEQTALVASTTRYISTWTRYLSTNPPDNVDILDRIWDVLKLKQWTRTDTFKMVHGRLLSAMGKEIDTVDDLLPHVGVSLSNPSNLLTLATRLYEVSLCSEYMSSHLTTMFYLARLTSAPEHILKETIDTLVSESVFNLVEGVTKFELAVQDRIPNELPPWMAFIARHGVYFVAHWLTAMDNLVYQQDPDNSSHIKLTFFQLFQVTALSLLQIDLPGDECVSHDVLIKILFNPRVLGKLLSQNTKQISVVKRILEPMYLQYFIKSDKDLKISQCLWSHDGRGLNNMVMDYSRITGQPLFNWLFYPIELLFRSKLNYVEESGTLIAATSVVHCTLDFVYSLLQTQDGISFELIYMAALKVLTLEGEREPARADEEEEADAEEEEDEEEGFIDQEVEATLNRLLDHFSTRGDSSLVIRDDAQGQAPLNEKILSVLTSPMPFSQFMKNFMENSFTTGTLLQFQATAARFLLPAMALSTELQLLIWQESFNFLGSVTTRWEELDAGTLKSLIQDNQGLVTSEVLKHYLKAVASGRVIKQRNPVLYWIAVHHLARVALGPIKMPAAPVRGKRVVSETQATEAIEDSTVAEERRAIVSAIVAGTKSEELVRDWVQYDSRNYDQPGATPGAPTRLNLTGLSSSVSAQSLPTTPTAPTSTPVRSSSRPLSLLSTSSSFPLIGSSDYLNCDNILTPPDCFRERRQPLVGARKDWISATCGDAALDRVEDAILAAAAAPTLSWQHRAL